MNPSFSFLTKKIFLDQLSNFGKNFENCPSMVFFETFDFWKMLDAIK